MTGDVTASANSFATTIAANAVTNAKMATMAAFTIKGNATGSTANATDISIPALTQKVSSAAGDFIMIADSAAANALKYVLVSSIASAGSVSSIDTKTGAFTTQKGVTTSGNAIQLANNSATLQANPANPTGAASVAGLMMGLGATCTITPSYSTRVMVDFKGTATNGSSGVQDTISVRFGTGTAPSNGAALTGTVGRNDVIGCHHHRRRRHGVLEWRHHYRPYGWHGLLARSRARRHFRHGVGQQRQLQRHGILASHRHP